MGALRYLRHVVTLELETDACNGCRRCVEVCPQAVLAVENGKARIIDRDACMECGACAMNCQAGALSVRSGVGCAAGVIAGILRGTEPSCDCGTSTDCCQ